MTCTPIANASTNINIRKKNTKIPGAILLNVFITITHGLKNG